MDFTRPLITIESYDNNNTSETTVSIQNNSDSGVIFSILNPVNITTTMVPSAYQNETIDLIVRDNQSTVFTASITSLTTNMTSTPEPMTRIIDSGINDTLRQTTVIVNASGGDSLLYIVAVLLTMFGCFYMINWLYNRRVSIRIALVWLGRIAKPESRLTSLASSGIIDEELLEVPPNLNIADPPREAEVEAEVVNEDGAVGNNTEDLQPIAQGPVLIFVKQARTREFESPYI